MTHDSVAPGGSVDRRRYDRVRVVDPRAARSARRQALSESAWRRGQSDTWPEKTRKVPGFAKCEMRNVQFRKMRNAKCPVSRNAKCEIIIEQNALQTLQCGSTPPRQIRPAPPLPASHPPHA